MTWEDERKRRYKFKNIYQSDILNIDRIHPLQQKNVIHVVEAIRETEVTKVIVIGSSLNLRCNPWSDLDIVFFGKPDRVSRSRIEMKVLTVVDGSIDILWLQDIKATNKILEDIESGVPVYE